MKQSIIQFTERVFDKLYGIYESPKGFRFISAFLVVIFLAALAVSYLNIMGWLPKSWGFLPSNFFDAVEIVFRLLLAIEILGMVFVLAHSVSKSVAKQFEILSLILLRQAFKEFSQYDIMHHWDEAFEPISYMFSDAFGALIIFIGIYYYLKIQQHRTICLSPQQNRHYTALKKIISLLMIAVFAGIAIYDLIYYIQTGEQIEFFLIFYTILIFTDILLVIISLRYNHSYAVVFRNSALAVATVFIRLALSAPRYLDAAIGILALGFAIVTGIFYNKFRNSFDENLDSKYLQKDEKE